MVRAEGAQDKGQDSGHGALLAPGSADAPQGRPVARRGVELRHLMQGSPGVTFAAAHHGVPGQVPSLQKLPEVLRAIGPVHLPADRGVPPGRLS